MKNFYIGLIHSPVLRNGATITSSITNLDLHDIARVCATYGLGGYFVIHPDDKMRSIAAQLASHWTEGEGKSKKKSPSSIRLPGSFFCLR